MKDVLICSVRVYKPEKKSLETSMRETFIDLLYWEQTICLLSKTKSTLNFSENLTVSSY